MVNSPALELAEWLATSLPALGTLHGQTPWSVHVGFEPPEPANVLTVYDTGGLGLDTDELDIEQPTIQVRIRSEAGEYPAAYTLMHEIKMLMAKATNIEAGTSTFQMMVLTSDFASIGRDERGRNIGTLNFQCRRVAK